MTNIDPALLALAGIDLPGGLPLVRSGWAHRIGSVFRHGLTGLLAEAWSDERIDLDEATIKRMGDQLAAEAIGAVRIEGELIRLEDTLTGLACAVLKGPVLAHAAYRNPQHRPFTDLDVLVGAADRDRLIERLEQLGYARTRPEPTAGFDSRVGKATTLEHPGGVVIDLHRNLAAGSAGVAIDIDEFLASRQLITVGPAQVPAPSWEAHLIEAALHAVLGDGLSRALSIRDVAQVGLHPDLNAATAVELARKWHVAGPVGAGLLVATEAFGLELDPSLVALAEESKQSHPIAVHPDEVRSARRRLDELLRGDLRTRFILSRALLAPTPAFLRWTYGSHPLVSLYGRRWRDLAHRVGDARGHDTVGARPRGPGQKPEVAGLGSGSGSGSASSSHSSGAGDIQPPRQERWTTARPPRAEPATNRPRPTASAVEVLERTDEPTGAGTAHTGPAEGSAALVGAGAVILAVTILATRVGINSVGIIAVPAAAICFALAASRRIVEKHPDEAWVGRWLVAGVIAKLIASYARYWTLVTEYEGVGDAVDYDDWGRRLAGAWLKGDVAPELDDLRKTNFIRWFTGVVYYLFGSNMVAGFFIFGLLAVAGSYFWYRAAADAVPWLDKRIFLGLILFSPSVAFWPGSIGKEALMQFGIGVVALGTSLVLRSRFLPGIGIAIAGGWLLWVVRPHLLALVTVAGGCAYIVGRVKSNKPGAEALLGRSIGMLIVMLLMAFTVSQGADFLGLEDLSLSSIEASLDEQTETTGQGGSSFDNGGNSLNPVNLPEGAMTVLLRPFPWETDSPFQLLSSMESIFLAGFMVMRRSSLKEALARARTTPFLLYCWVLTILYSATFSSFANFGILVRQRSLVLPALFVLIAVRRRSEIDEIAAELNALAPPQDVAVGSP